MGEQRETKNPPQQIVAKRKSQFSVKKCPWIDVFLYRNATLFYLILPLWHILPVSAVCQSGYKGLATGKLDFAHHLLIKLNWSDSSEEHSAGDWAPIPSPSHSVTPGKPPPLSGFPFPFQENAKIGFLLFPRLHGALHQVASWRGCRGLSLLVAFYCRCPQHSSHPLHIAASFYGFF